MPTEECLVQTLAMLCEVYNRKCTAALEEAYAIGLDGLTDEQVKAGLSAVLANPKFQFLPTPGQFREVALTGGQGFEGMAQRAWQALNRAIDTAGYTKSVNFADGAINATIRHLGGWVRVCSLPDEEFEKWFRRDFERAYLRFAAEGCDGALTQPLIGAVERESGHYHGLPNPRSGATYLLPPVAEIGVNYEPVVPALPAPERTSEPLRLPLLQTVQEVFSEEEQRESAAKLPKRMKKKCEVPRAHEDDWTNRDDLEFELTTEQLAAEAANRKQLLALADQP